MEAPYVPSRTSAALFSNDRVPEGKHKGGGEGRAHSLPFEYFLVVLDAVGMCVFRGWGGVNASFCSKDQRTNVRPALTNTLQRSEESGAGERYVKRHTHCIAGRLNGKRGWSWRETGRNLTSLRRPTSRVWAPPTSPYLSIFLIVSIPLPNELYK